MAYNVEDLKYEAPPKATSQETAASASNAQKRRLAFILEDLNSFLRATAAARDFFEGYSLSEAIQERLDVIGSIEQSKTQSPDKKPTLIAELDIILETGLAAISAAREYGTLEQKEDDSEEVEAVDESE